MLRDLPAIVAKFGQRIGILAATQPKSLIRISRPSEQLIHYSDVSLPFWSHLAFKQPARLAMDRTDVIARASSLWCGEYCLYRI
jgi:hypothetical protein